MCFFGEGELCGREALSQYEHKCGHELVHEPVLGGIEVPLEIIRTYYIEEHVGAEAGE